MQCGVGGRVNHGAALLSRALEAKLKNQQIRREIAEKLPEEERSGQLSNPLLKSPSPDDSEGQIRRRIDSALHRLCTQRFERFPCRGFRCERSANNAEVPSLVRGGCRAPQFGVNAIQAGARPSQLLAHSKVPRRAVETTRGIFVFALSSQRASDVAPDLSPSSPSRGTISLSTRAQLAAATAEPMSHDHLIITTGTGPSPIAQLLALSSSSSSQFDLSQAPLVPRAIVRLSA
ncbi:unnamed protein product [Lampetra fluviatilis]